MSIIISVVLKRDVFIFLLKKKLLLAVLMALLEDNLNLKEDVFLKYKHLFISRGDENEDDSHSFNFQ